MIVEITILEITATNMEEGDIKVDEDIESTHAKKFHSKVIYKGVLKTVQLHVTKDLSCLEKSI